MEALQSIEDKVLALVDEVERLRTEAKRLREENANLSGSKQQENEKLQGILSLLEGVETTQVEKETSAESEAVTA